MEDDSAFTFGKEKTFGSLIGDIVFSHVGMFFIIACYACFGAWAFIQLEKGAEADRYKDKQDAAYGASQTVDYTANLLWYYGDSTKFNWTFPLYNQSVFHALTNLQNFILDACSNHHYDGTIDGWEEEWTFLNSLLLTLTIIVTIGYGTVTPKTPEGMMFCIIYGIVGVPVFLVFIGNFGNSMAEGFTYIYSRLCCRWCRSTRYLSEVPENQSTKTSKQILDDVVGKEVYMPTYELFVPITINIVVLHLYMMLGAILFNTWEDWGLTASFYFTFVTVSTIGYGDFVPGTKDVGTAAILKLLSCVLYIVIGVALLSMCINLMQEQLVEKCKWVAHEVGLLKNNSVEEPKPPGSRKDSLLPIMEENKGSSPFRNSSSGVENEAHGSKNIPGIVDA